MSNKILKMIIVFIILIFLLIILFVFSILKSQQTSIDQLQNMITITQSKTNQNYLSDNKFNHYNLNFDINKVELIFNGRTKELFSIFDHDIKPHTCVWTLWGTHGNFTTLITRVDTVVGHVGYVGHVLNKDYFDVLKKSDEFWPSSDLPKTPIYMTCVDSKNKIYVGAINTE